MQDLLSLEGKVAIITGGAAGIGLATAQLLSAHGAKIALLDVNPQGKGEAGKIRKEGCEAEFFSCDVTSAKAVSETVDAVMKRWRQIDILFNNAGVTVRKTVVDLTEREWDFVLHVGLKGVFLL